MSSEPAFLDAADRIGRRIAQDAVWYRDRCAWVGAVAHEREPWRIGARALGPSVYDGTAGVGLFLAELADVTGDESSRIAAVGALRHAVGRARALEPDRRDGFHAGTLGVAWAAMRCGRLTGEESLVAAAGVLAARAVPRAPAVRCADVVQGCAGALVGLVALAAELKRPDLLDEALATGEALLAAARVTRRGWCWPVPGEGRPGPLCGLAHGAAGIGWALLELFATTGEARFGAAAGGAFAWERSWLDERSGAWPDLRLRVPAARQPVRPPATGATWCHGEAGIALTRLRATAVLSTDAERRDAEVALVATRRHVEDALRHDIHDLTLCHGAAGAADVLASGPGQDGGDGPARRLGCAVLERYDRPGAGYPGGTASVTSPALFCGLSGIGWWFLRLARPAIPSPLMLPVRSLTVTGEPA